MEPITETFSSGEVLAASKLNTIVEALNNVISYINNSEGGGSIPSDIEQRLQTLETGVSTLDTAVLGLDRSVSSINGYLESGYLFVGVATPSTIPGSSTAKRFYLCAAGEYSNFDQGFIVSSGYIGILSFYNAWSLETIKVGIDEVTTDVIADKAVTKAKLSQSLQDSITAFTSEGYKFGGVATLAETPATPTISIFKIASAVGTYTNYNLSVSQSDGVCAFLYDVSASTPVWTKLLLGIPFPPETNMLVETFSASLINAQENKYYRATAPVETLAIILPIQTDASKTKNIMFYFEGGTTPSVLITAEDNRTVEYYENFQILSGVKYELNCMFNGESWVVAYGVIPSHI